MKKLILGVLACVGAMSSCAMVKPLEGTWLKPGEKLVCFGDSITANEGNEELIENTSHFRVSNELVNGQNELHIHFNKDVMLSIINKYYAHDKSKQINDDLFKSYAKNHPRFRGTRTVRFKEEQGSRPANSMSFNITGLPEFSGFGSMSIMSAAELKNSVEGNNM